MNWRNLAFCFAIFAALYVLAGLAFADEPLPPAMRFEQDGVEVCSIFVTASAMKVRGSDPDKCIDYLETSAKLAKSERMVNKKRRR